MILAFILVNANIEYLSARRLICIDADPNDNGFLSNAEGWERQNLREGDEIHVGGNLDSCLKKAKNGDTIIIICHGWGAGKGYKWGGTRYRGFGTGDSLHPLPPGFDTLKNCKVTITSCWSERDPDGGGPDKPVTEKLKDKMGPPSNGNSVSGFTNRVFAGNAVSYNYDPEQTDTATINNFLRTGNQSWQKCPPVNRKPPANVNQKTCLQTLLDSVKGGPGKVTVGDITYRKPYNGTNSVLDTCICDCNADDYCGCTDLHIISIPICPVSSYNWIPQISGTVNSLLTVCAVNSKICWAGGTLATVRKTTDGGLTWTNANGGGISGDVYNIFALDEFTAFCTTTPSSSTFIFKTTNGGATWQGVYTQSGGFIDAIQMISSTEGYALGDPVGGKWTILKTTNAGDFWARIPTEPVQVGAEAGWNNSFIIRDTYMWFGTNSTKVYRSGNLGASWSSAPTPGVLSSYAVHYNNNFLGLAGGTGMVKSIDGGLSYVPGINPAVNVSGLDGYFSAWWATAFNANIYLSTDQGLSWTPVYAQTGSVFNAIDITSEGGCATGWAVDNAGRIAKLSGEQAIVLDLTAIIEGGWNGVSNIGDTLKVNIRKSVSPYNIVENAQGLSDINGNVILNFTNSQILNGDDYYIEVTHRNSIATWSKSGGEAWGGSVLNYDLTSAATQAYGDNLKLVAGKYCIYGGDVNQDEVIDGADLSLIDNDASNFVTGYVQTDLNFDTIVDGSDAALCDNNASNFVSVIKP